jgi:hypothetical protein
MKDYINVQGIESPRGTIIKTVTTSAHFVTHSANSILMNVTLSGQLGSPNYALLYCPGHATSTHQSVAIGIDFDDTETAIIQDTSVGSSRLYLDRCAFTETTDAKYGCRVTATSPHTATCAIDGTYMKMLGTSLVTLNEVSGVGTNMLLSNMMVDNLAYTGSYAIAYDSAVLSIANVTTNGFDKALYIPNTGTGPTLGIRMNANNSGTKDVEILNATTAGVLAGNLDYMKVSSVSPNISLQLASSSGMVVTGNMYNGETLASITNVSPSVKNATILGVISGGVHSESGLDVTITAGTGYIITGTIPTEALKLITWIE